MDDHLAITRQERLGCIAFGIFLMVFGIFWTIASLSIPSRAAYSISPGLLPTWAGVTLAMGGLLLAFASWRRIGIADDVDDPLFDWRGQGRIWSAQIVVLLYVLGIETFHYALTTFLAMTALLIAAGEPLRWPLFVKSAAITASMFFIFVVWLGVPLPGNRFG